MCRHQPHAYICQECTPDELADCLIEASNAYYLLDTPVMSDAAYDYIERRLREIAPHHSYFKKVGTKT